MYSAMKVCHRVRGFSLRTGYLNSFMFELWSESEGCGEIRGTVGWCGVLYPTKH